MKLHPILPAILFAVAAPLSFGVHAEDAVTPHSHLEVKSSVAAKPKPKAGEAAAQEKASATAGATKEDKAEKKAKKKANHSHPTDAK